MNPYTSPRLIICVVLIAGLTACGKSADPKAAAPVRIAYAYHLEKDRDSLSTPLIKGQYEVRIEGDCSTEELVLTEGGVGQRKFGVTGLVAAGLTVEKGGRWRIRQHKGDQMMDCKAVVLYPEGVPAPPVQPRSTTTTQATTTTTTTTMPAPTTTIDPAVTVAKWADKHLNSIAKAHGNLVGLIDGARMIRSSYGNLEVSQLCRAASEDPDSIVHMPDDALKAYPGRLDLAGSLTRLRDETKSVMDRCIADAETLDSIGAWMAADLDLAMTALLVIDEAGRPMDPDEPTTVRYEEARQEQRDRRVYVLRAAALGVPIPE